MVATDNRVRCEMHEVKQVEKYGAIVYQNEFMDNLRRDECLCLHCGYIKDCSTAKAFYVYCQQFDLALAVTRCPNFKV